MERAKRSVVWQYFTKNGKESATCGICKKTLKTRSFSTGSLRQHLQRIHSFQFLEIELLTEENTDNSHQSSDAEPEPSGDFVEKRDKPKKSAVWQYFTKSSDKKSVTCNMCNKVFKYHGGTGKFKKHLDQIHPFEILENETLMEEITGSDKKPASWNDSCNQSSEMVPESSDDSLEKHDRTTIKSFDSTTHLKQHLESIPSIQLPKEDILPGLVSDPLEKHDDTKEPPMKQLKLFSDRKDNVIETKISNIEKALLKLITNDYQPLSIVENKVFLDYSRALNPLYKPFSRKKLTNEILPKYYKTLTSELKTILSKVKDVAISTDIWKSYRNITYITVTCHFVFQNKLCSRVLCTKSMWGEHTSENITETLNLILNEWSVTDKVVTIVSDNSENIKKAIVDNLQKYHQPCVALTLNLSVNEAISNNERLSFIVNKCRDLVGYFKYNVVASEKLKSTQQQMQLPELNVKQDVPSSWTSCFIMLERLVKIKEPLTIVVTNIPMCPEFLDDEEWAIIVDIIQILKPGYELTTVLSTDKYPPVSIVIPLIRGLQHTLKNIIPKTDVGEIFKNNLLEIVTRRLGIFEKIKNVAMATFLDPRFKKTGFGLEENAANAQKWIIEELGELYAKRQNEVENEENICESETINSNINFDDPWYYFEQKLAEKKMSPTSTNMVTLMITQYLEMPLLNRQMDPLSFWSKHEAILPEMAKLAFKYLCVPATSVPSESIFSKSGQLINSRRNRLSPTNLDKIIFLNSCDF